MTSVGKGCFLGFFLLFFGPYVGDFMIGFVSDSFGPKLEDYCKKDNVVKIYDPVLYEQRRQEVEDKGAAVTPGWHTIISKKHEDQFLYNSIRTRTAVLFFNNKKIAQTRFYSLDRENLITLIGWAPPRGNPCMVARDRYLKHVAVISPSNDSRFASEYSENAK